MIEAVGVYSSLINGLNVVISASKVVELKFLEGAFTTNLTDGVKYRITAALQVDYVKEKEARFRAKVISAVPVTEPVSDFARYRGVFRINEGAGGMQERVGGGLLFYRGDAFSDELSYVDLSMVTGWVTIAVPKDTSCYTYRAGDLIYVDGKLFHKNRDVGGKQTYELCVRAEKCYKIDGTEYWERVRAAQHRALKRGIVE